MTNTLRRFFNPYVAVALLYLLSILLIQPWGNFPVNDDWDFLVHTINFSKGDLIKNALIDSTFIFQGFVGVVWGKIFGFSFTSMRTLTMLVSLAALFGIYKILCLYQADKLVKFIILGTVAFNPMFFSSSLTYMTENYFLLLMIFSIFYFTKFLRNKDIVHFLFAVLLAGLSVLVRQFGLVILFAYLVTTTYLLIKDKSNILNKYKIYLVPIIASVLAVSCFTAFNWPQHTLVGQRQSAIERFEQVLDTKKVIAETFRLPWVLPYIGFFLSPLTIIYLLKQKKFVVVGCILFSLIMFSSIYYLNIFPLGNTVYVEGFYAKSDYYPDLNLFDNVVFKLLISFYISLSLTTLAVFLFSFSRSNLLKPLYRSAEAILVVLLLLGTFFSVAIIPEFFDRYFINFFILLIIYGGFMILKSLQISGKFIHATTLLPLIIFSVFLAQDYYAATTEKVRQADLIKNDRGLKTKVFVNGAYTRWEYVGNKSNFPYVQSPIPPGLKYECFVESYSKSDNNHNLLYLLLNRLANSRKVQNVFPPVKIVDAKSTAGVVRIEQYKKHIVINKEYPSLIFNLMGKEAYVGSFCLDK